MDTEYFVGVDVGTQSVRAGLVTCKGAVLEVSSLSITTSNPYPDMYEQSTDDIWALCVQVIKDVTKGLDVSLVRGIGFDATCSLVALDKNFQPLSINKTGKCNQNIMLWMDHRAVEEANFINSKQNKVLQYVGSKISPEMEPPKLLWLKKNLPNQWKRAGHFFDLPDYLTWKATGSLQRSLCSLGCKWTYAPGDTNGGWQDDFWTEIGLDDLVSENYEKIGTSVLLPGEPCGKGLSVEAAKETGLIAGTPVSASIIDAHSGGLGLLACTVSNQMGDSLDDRMALISGTSTCHMKVSKNPIFTPGVWGPYFSAMVPNYWCSEAGQSAAGALLDHVINSHPASIALKHEMLSNGDSRHITDVLNETAEELKKSKGFLSISFLTSDYHVYPDFHGNRSPVANPDIKGMICGLSLSSDRENLVKLYLATVQALAKHFENDQWLDFNKKRLKKDALPTVFSHAPNNLKRKSPIERPFIKRMKFSTDDVPVEEISVPVEEVSIDTLKKKLEHSDKTITDLKRENLVLKLRLKREILRNAQYKYRHQKKLKNGNTKDIFEQDQIMALNRKSMAYTKWSNKTVEKALTLRFSCGSKGYEHILSLGMPFPSIRTLQRRLENLKFESGILVEVLAFMKIKVASFNEHEKLCVLLLDEMAITESVNFDMSTCTYFGNASSPFSGKASQALTFMICGISTRWKQVIAYYFTNKESKGATLKGLVVDIIGKLHDIGLKVICVTSDMSSLNQGMWREFGVYCNRINTKSFISLPENPNQEIQFIADPPHLLKNIRSSLLANSHIVIPRALKRKYNLPTNRVTADHLKELTSYQENMDLKLAYKLTSDQLDQGHFDKMKVGPARTVLSHDVSCSLKFLSEEIKKEQLLTTAWFISHISKWFDLVTSRSPKLALSHLNILEHQKAEEFLLEIIELFKKMKVVANDGKMYWKPIQTGVILTTTAILSLQKQLLNNNFKFVLTSRFTQDSLENLFGVLRSKQVIPNALQFKNNLKLVCISQYLKKCTTGSYETDDGEFLSGFLDVIKDKPAEDKHVLILPPDWDRNKEDVPSLSIAEQNCLYSIAGYVVHSLKKLHSVCQTCILSVASKEATQETYARLVKHREYKKNCLYYVHNEVFEAFLEMELLFRSIEGMLMQSSNCKELIKQKFKASESLQLFVKTESCHSVRQKLVNRFSTFRLKIFCTKKRRQMFAKAKAKDPCMSSKSVAMRVLAKNV